MQSNTNGKISITPMLTAALVASSLVVMPAHAKNGKAKGKNNSKGVISLMVNTDCEIYIDSTKDISNIIFNLGMASEEKIEEPGGKTYVLGDYMDGITYDSINVKAGNNGTRGVGEALDLTVPDAPECDTSVVTYAVGDVGPRGGIVMAVNAAGTSGWEVALSDAVLPSGQATFDWGCSGEDIPGIVNIASTGPGSASPAEVATDNDDGGNLNSLEILLSCNSLYGFTTTAASGAANETVWPDGSIGGSLPNRRELYTIYLYQLSNSNLGGFSAARYWSSSETDADSAWTINFTGGDDIFSRDKSTTEAVRAISYF